MFEGPPNFANEGINASNEFPRKWPAEIDKEGRLFNGVNVSVSVYCNRSLIKYYQYVDRITRNIFQVDLSFETFYSMCETYFYGPLLISQPFLFLQC